MPDPTDRFAELVARPGDEVPLDEAALLIAAHAYPGLDVAAELERIDRLAAGCAAPTLDAVVDHLFGAEGFGGNTDDYSDVRNSYLNDVLERRVGIPISLSVLVMEVGRRLGLGIQGVGMPAHFLVRHGDTFVDAFDGGRLLDARGCFRLFLQRGGSPTTFDPSFLDPVGPHAILLRMLTNLRALFAHQGDTDSLLWVGRLRAVIPGVPLSDQRDHARLLVNLGRFGEAAEVIEGLAAAVSDDDATRLEDEARQLRARLN
jgi:regulator of sirC expression with transglutaminase-like and TPR domain